MPSYLYILRLTSGTLYIGATHDLEKRVAEHFSGDACRTTALDTPIKLIYSETFDTFGKARTREKQIKRWSRGKKEASVAGDVEKLHQLAGRKKT